MGLGRDSERHVVGVKTGFPGYARYLQSTCKVLVPVSHVIVALLMLKCLTLSAQSDLGPALLDNGGGGGRLKSLKFSSASLALFMPPGLCPKGSLSNAAQRRRPGELQGGNGRGELEHCNSCVRGCRCGRAVFWVLALGECETGAGGDVSGEYSSSLTRWVRWRGDICVGTTVLTWEGRKVGGDEGGDSEGASCSDSTPVGSAVISGSALPGFEAASDSGSSGASASGSLSSPNS